MRVSGRMTRRVVTVLRDAGVDVSALSLELLENRDARVEVSAVDALMEFAVKQLGAVGLGERIAQVFDEETYDAAGRVMLGAATLGEALSLAFAHQRLWGDGERFSLRDDDGVLRVGFHHPGRSAVAGAVLSELAFVEVMSAVKLLVSQNAHARSVQLRHRKLGALAACFGVEPRYGAAANVLELDDAPLQVPRELMQQVLTRDAEKAVRQLPSLAAFVPRARAAASDFPDLATLAHRLRVSARTLQRRLAAEGTSHFELVDALRREAVARFDAQGFSSKQTSFEVGFSDERALARARKRWLR